MREAHRVEGEEGALDAGVDPRLGPTGHALRAQPDHIGEGGVGGDAEPVGGDRLAQRLRQVEAVQRQDRAAARFHPIHAVRLAAVRHREHAHRIGAEYQLRVEHVAHAASRTSTARHTSANARADGEPGAAMMTGARAAVAASIALAIGIVGQSGRAASAAA